MLLLRTVISLIRGLLVGGAYQAVNTLAQYNAAWLHIIQLFNSQGAGHYVKWQLDINCTNGLDSPLSTSAFYPKDVDQYFDSVSITCYNRSADVALRLTLSANLSKPGFGSSLYAIFARRFITYSVSVSLFYGIC